MVVFGDIVRNYYQERGGIEEEISRKTIDMRVSSE